MEVYARLEDMAPAVSCGSLVLVHRQHPGRVRFVMKAEGGSQAGVEVAMDIGLACFYGTTYYVSGGFAGIIVRLSEISVPNPASLSHLSFPPHRTPSEHSAPMLCTGVADVQAARLLALEALAGLDQSLVDRLSLRGSSASGLGITTLVWGICLLLGVSDVPLVLNGRSSVVPLMLAADPQALAQHALQFSKFHAFLSVNGLLPADEPLGSPPTTETPHSFLLSWLRRLHQYALLLRTVAAVMGPWPGHSLRSPGPPRDLGSLLAEVVEARNPPSCPSGKEIGPGSSFSGPPAVRPSSPDSLSITSPGTLDSPHSRDWRLPPRLRHSTDHFVELRPPTPVSDVVVFRYNPQPVLMPRVGREPVPRPSQFHASDHPDTNPAWQRRPLLEDVPLRPSHGHGHSHGPRPPSVQPADPLSPVGITNPTQVHSPLRPSARNPATTRLGGHLRGRASGPRPSIPNTGAEKGPTSTDQPDVFQRLYGDALRQHRLRAVLARREQERNRFVQQLQPSVSPPAHDIRPRTTPGRGRAVRAVSPPRTRPRMPLALALQMRKQPGEGRPFKAEQRAFSGRHPAAAGPQGGAQPHMHTDISEPDIPLTVRDDTLPSSPQPAPNPKLHGGFGSARSSSSSSSSSSSAMLRSH